jgi:hypothetical protein
MFDIEFGARYLSQRFLTQEGAMSFREKSAWAMVFALLVAGVNYFRIVGQASLSLGHISPPSAGLVMAYIIALALIAVFGQVVIAALSPAEAAADDDERDHLIAARAGSVFGHVLAVGLVGVLLAYVVGPHGGTLVNGDALFQGALSSLMIAQLAEYAAQIWFYRRGL